MNEKQIILYNRATEITRQYNQEVTELFIDSTQFAGKQNKTQTSQLNNLIALEAIGFAGLDDRLENLENSLSELNLENKAEKHIYNNLIEVIDKKLERIIQNQEIKPDNSIEINRKLENIQKQNSEIIQVLEKINRNIELIPKDSYIPDSLEPKLSDLEKSLENLYLASAEKTETINKLSEIIINSQNEVIKGLEKHNIKRINPIKSHNFIIYNPPENE